MPITFTYIGATLFIAFALIGLAIFLAKRDMEWQEWFLVLLMALAADILSTIYFVYIANLGWSGEVNITVQYLGPYIGNFNALLINHFMLALILGLVGFIFRKEYTSIYILPYFIFIMLLSGVTLSNIILTTLEIVTK